MAWVVRNESVTASDMNSEMSAWATPEYNTFLNSSHDTLKNVTVMLSSARWWERNLALIGIEVELMES